MKESGKFIISLDFELLWGMRDHETIESYGRNIIGVRDVLPKILALFEKYGIKATFATVGFLFASDKEELISFFPVKKPQYTVKNLSPYNGYLNKVKDNEEVDKYHFAHELINLIKEYPDHEIASHTFSHYYGLEKGQTTEQFRADINAAIKIAIKNKINLKSMVFPRNQINSELLEECSKVGINSFRGNENAWFYKEESREKKILYKRFLKLLDTYINVAGHLTYSISDIKRIKPYCIPGSRFLRPYNPKLVFGESFRVNRILNSMTYAAKKGEVFHLWWHPHNFGKYSKQNFKVLEKILMHFKVLNLKYNFESCTMEMLSQKLEINFN